LALVVAALQCYRDMEEDVPPSYQTTAVYLGPQAIIGTSSPVARRFTPFILSPRHKLPDARLSPSAMLCWQCSIRSLGLYPFKRVVYYIL